MLPNASFDGCEEPRPYAAGIQRWRMSVRGTPSADVIPANTQLPPRPEDLIPLMDKWGSKETFPHMAASARRPDLMGPHTTLTLYEGMEGIMENTFINVKNHSKALTADVEIPADGASVAQPVKGGRFDGWSLHLHDGKPTYEYNWFGLERFIVESLAPLPAGRAPVKLDFAYDGNDLGKGGEAKISVNGREVAKRRIGKTQQNVFSADETADVGLDNQTPVALRIGYGPRETKFTGSIYKIAVELK